MRSSMPSITRRNPGHDARRRQRLDPDPCCREIVDRQIDPIERAVVVGAILQVVEHLQRRAQRIRRRARSRGFRHAGRAAGARPARPNSGNTPSDRPSRDSAAWSRRAEKRAARRGSAARRPRLDQALPHRRGGRRVADRARRRGLPPCGRGGELCRRRVSAGLSAISSAFRAKR